MKIRFLVNLLKDHASFILVLLVVILAAFLTLPVLTHILPHPDEQGFYFSAFNILLGKPLNNYLHVALTEYLLAFYFLLIKLFTYPGVDLYTTELNTTIFNYGRVFGFGLYLLTFFLGCLILAQGRPKVTARHVFFAVLYFGSLGIFERFLRINSEAVAVLVALNYLFLSSIFIERRVKSIYVFGLDLLFIFLISFSNLKYLFLVGPILMVNLIFCLVRSSATEAQPSETLLRLHKPLVYFLGLLVGVIFLWSWLIPKPFDVAAFWRDVTIVTQSNTVFDFDYPSQAYGSWLFYPYDLMVEYWGLTSLLTFLILVVLAAVLKGRGLFKDLRATLGSQIRLRGFYQGDFYPKTILVLVLSFLSYYLFVGHNLIHWSRWGLPLAVWGFLILSLFLEKVFNVLRNRFSVPVLFLLISPLFLLAWILKFFLFIDLRNSSYPQDQGYHLVAQDVHKFLSQVGVASADEDKKAVWFGSVGGGLRNISLDQLGDKKNQEVTYVLWPYWNLGVLYAGTNVDKTIHNQKALVSQIATSVTYRFPSYLSYYTHATTYFAWHNLHLTWIPEIDSLIEAQYAVVKLKSQLGSLAASYPVRADDASNCGRGFWVICQANPGPRQVVDLVDLKANGNYYDHSLWFRNFFKGVYKVKILNSRNSDLPLLRVYATQPFAWQPESRTLVFRVDQQIISVEVGFSSPHRFEPQADFVVDYSLK